MWENETTQPEQPDEESERKKMRKATRAELRHRLQPPRAQRGKEKNHLLRCQCLLCLAILLATPALQRFWPEAFGNLQNWYQTYAQAQPPGLAGEQLVRFAWAGVQNATHEADAFLDTLAGKNGAGGQLSAKYPHLPAGYSTDSYLPAQTLRYPLHGFAAAVNSGYGWRENPVTFAEDFHSGLDLAAALGTPVYAALPGVVVYSETGASYGNYVRLRHAGGNETLYAHLQYSFVRTGQWVDTDTCLGAAGSTGVSTGPHLHFELLHNGVRYDPAEALL